LKDGIMEWLLRRRFRALLLSSGMLLLAYPLLHQVLGGRFLFDGLLTLVFLTAMLVTFRRPRTRLTGVALGTPLVVGIWSGYVVPGIPRLAAVITFHSVAALFLGFILVNILRAVHEDDRISADSIFGALCGFVLIGLVFGHLYCLVEAIQPGSFQGDATFAAGSLNDPRQHFLLLYLSFMTVTSVGYGDITPLSDPARSLAVVEALTGQFYLAVLIGELIGKRVSQVLAERPPSGGQ
jgi:hypothetical protein